VAGGPYTYLRQSSWKIAAVMPAASAEMATATSEPSTSTSTPRKAVSAPEKKYKCQFCNRAFSRSEHRSRHERSRKLNYFCCCCVGRPVREVELRGNPTKLFSLLTSTFHRHQRETLSMHEMSKHLCSSRPSPTPRQDRPCKRSGNTSGVRRKKAWRD
jgi:hypothetical protein